MNKSSQQRFPSTFQNIDHGFILFSLSVCMFYIYPFLWSFGLKTCFIFRIFLCILSHFLRLKQGDHVQDEFSALLSRIHDAQQEFTFNTLLLLWRVKAASSVFSDWRWPSPSFQYFMTLYSCWQTVDWGCNLCHFQLLFPSFCLPSSCSCFVSFAPLFAKLDFAVFPDAFPCIIYEKKKKIKRKKKHLAYFSL